MHQCFRGIYSQELSKNFEKVSKELFATKVQSEQQLKLMEAEKQALQSQVR
jgi:hypothetical protein